MDWKSYIYGVMSMAILLLAASSFGLAHMGSITGFGISGGAVSDKSADSMAGHHEDSTSELSGSYSDIPEKCRPPAGQDINSWKEHLGHHQETKECLRYFE